MRPAQPIHATSLRAPVLWLLLLGVLTVTGCSHYRLGRGGSLPFRSIYVAPVENPAAVPQADALVSTLLRDAVLKDGRVTLARSAADADAVLTVRLTGYGREMATARPGDTGLARKFVLHLNATVHLRDQRAGVDLIAEKTESAARDSFTDGGQTQSEYEALPHLAETLARNIARTALSSW